MSDDSNSHGSGKSRTRSRRVGDETQSPDAMPGYEGLLAHAMIAAAAASGDIDPDQKMRIVRQSMKAGIESGHDARFKHALAHPWTPRRLADHCLNEHQRLAVYQAAVQAANPSSEEATGFLEALYVVLSITRAQRVRLHRLAGR